MPAHRARRPSLAFATYAAAPALQADDELLAAALGQCEFNVEAVVWSDPRADWRAFDAVVLRSTWDYHLNPVAFRAWLDALDAAGVAVLNPTSVVRWNLDKRYLRALASRGVATVPTRWVERARDAQLDALLDETGWDEVVVKPAVSASAHDTWRASRASAAADAPRLRALAESGAVLVQPFLREIEREGEWSLLFFGGRYSHAVCKRPRAGDFRVQPHLGGTSAPAIAPPPTIAAAERALTEALALTGCDAGALPYARVDGCRVDGEFRLMELELIEPTLFLAQEPAAPDRCAAALREALRHAAPPAFF